MKKYKYLIGVDQSMSNTGIVVLDSEESEIILIDEIKGKPIAPDILDFKDYYFLERARVDRISDTLIEIASQYPKEEVYFYVENLASGSTGSRIKSKDTDYLLSYLFHSIFDRLDKEGYKRTSVPPTTHKKTFFPVASGKKIEMYFKYWDTCFLSSGIKNKLTFKSLDQKDAFCLAYFGYLRQKYTREDIFSYRTIKARGVGEGRILEAIKGHLCFHEKKSKLCWRCPVYLACNDKKRYKMPKTKKEQASFLELQKIAKGKE